MNTVKAVAHFILLFVSSKGQEQYLLNKKTKYFQQLVDYELRFLFHSIKLLSIFHINNILQQQGVLPLDQTCYGNPPHATDVREEPHSCCLLLMSSSSFSVRNNKYFSFSDALYCTVLGIRELKVKI